MRHGRFSWSRGVLALAVVILLVLCFQRTDSPESGERKASSESIYEGLKWRPLVKGTEVPNSTSVPFLSGEKIVNGVISPISRSISKDEGSNDPSARVDDESSRNTETFEPKNGQSSVNDAFKGDLLLVKNSIAATGDWRRGVNRPGIRKRRDVRGSRGRPYGRYVYNRKPVAYVHVQPSVNQVVTPRRYSPSTKCVRCMVYYKPCPPTVRQPIRVWPKKMYQGPASKWRGPKYGCRCNSAGSIGATCDIVTGQCQCKPRVIGRTCDHCQVGYWGLAAGSGCISCDCDTIGALNSSCDNDTGRCHCRSGIGGTRCNTCLTGYYGFSETGCRPCEPCRKPGHICDPETGRCACPKLTYGEHCDRCRSGAYGLIPGIGCTACSCSPGAKRAQCDPDGQCDCRDGFHGQRCDRCAKGYYGYPKCKPCACNAAGTLRCDNEVCACNENGQCPCKMNAIGRQCNACREGTFGLTSENPNGCTECFCFGRSSSCQDSRFSWSQRRSQRPRTLRVNETVSEITMTNFGTTIPLPPLNRGLNISNGYSIIPETEGDVILPSRFYYNQPLYWQLPEAFLGDKVTSYGGFIEIKSESEGGEPANFQHPLVILQGNDKIIIEHYLQSAIENNSYKIRLHESMWQIQNRPQVQVSREMFMIALQNVQNVLLRATDYSGFTKITLLEAALDVAVLTPTHSPPLAMDVESCECPPEYNGTSCQNPSVGYYRWYNNETTTSTAIIDLVGQARPCQCNGRSRLCDPETGYCSQCSENTAGARCELCADSFYGHPEFGGCKPCPCPHADKRFSSTCDILSEIDVVCHCKPGYAGSKCQRCAPGYYGSPNIPGGSCVSCDCNPAGSKSFECDDLTGQCDCRPGSMGRDCSQCSKLRHVFIDNVCTSCNDNCTGILLDYLDILSIQLANETSHIANDYIPPPWEDLSYVNGNVSRLFQEVKLEKQLRQRIKNIPWREYRKMKKRTANLLEKATDCSNRASIFKSKSNDIKNNMYSTQLEIQNVHRQMKDTIKQWKGYSDEDSKINMENAYREAILLLNMIKNVDLSGKTKDIQSVLNNATKYIDWLNSIDDGTEKLSDARKNVNLLDHKVVDLSRIIETIMENLFEYDGLFQENTEKIIQSKNDCDQINDFHIEAIASIDEGQNLINDGRQMLNNAKNHIENLPELDVKLSNLTDILESKEGILYRLNYEYEEKYVLPAVQHARNLSNYVDECISLFAKTKNEAVNPLKASRAYKNIADDLNSAKSYSREAKAIIDGIHDQIFPPRGELRSVLDVSRVMVEKSAKLLDRAKIEDETAISLRNQLEAQKQGITDLKDTLTETGIRDNQINIKLRELKSSSIESQKRLQSLLQEDARLMQLFGKTTRDVENYTDQTTNVLKPKLLELKREGDSKISLASEKLTEAQSNIKQADAKLISLTNAALKRKSEFDKWNDTLAAKLQNLKDKISEARNTAEGIRISLKSVEGKKCIRSYRPSTLQPGTTTSIVLTFAIESKQQQGSLFYLPSSISDDFVALEMVDRRIRFLWNVGGGTGVVTHPEAIESGDLMDDSFWYRIEAERTRNVGKLSVRKQASTTGRYLPVLNATNSEYGRFDVTSSDRVWLGGIPESQRRPAELVASNGLPGCMHQVILDGKPIGLWNFITSAPDKACQACVEGVEDPRGDIAYSFNGEGYAVRNRTPSGPYSKYTFGVSLNFKTFDENTLLFLAMNPKNSQHVMIFLREGRVILHIGYGGNMSMEMSSMEKYNTGNWTKIDAFRQYQLRKGIEQCSLSVGSNNDKKIGAPTPQPKKEDIPDLAQAKYYIGGVPPGFRNDGRIILPPQVSFLGCMSNIFVQDGYDPMAEQYYGVEASCGSKNLKIVGFYGNGYFEHHAFTLRKVFSSFSFSFRTLQSKAMLLLSTYLHGLNDSHVDPVNEDAKENYYSVAVVKGHIQVRLSTVKGELVVQSNSTFNDGKWHSVSVLKKRKDVELRIDDAYEASGILPTATAIRAPERSGGLFFGGLPESINDTSMVTVNVPLIGAMKDIIFNDEVLKLDAPVSFNHALIGRPGPTMGKDNPTHISSASLSRGMSTQPEGCLKVPYYSLEPGALKFGDKPHSHTQLYLNFTKFWEKKYIIEFEFRTYYPNGLLFITPGIRLKHYLMMVVRNGQLSLLVKSRQKKEILFKSAFNDGNWHHVTIKHDERKLTVSVDNHAPQTIKVPKKIGLVTMMYIGGLPESGTPLPDQVVVKLETLKGCIRDLKINGNIHDMVGSTGRAYNVGQCFPSVETGAYFQDDAYAVYERNFELGAVLELQLEFRTSESSGVLLSITAADGSPSLSLELYNGKVIMSADLGTNNPLYVEQHFASAYTVCDNRWHRVQALYNDEQLALKVDELDQKYGLPTNGNDYHFIRPVVSSPLYIGGLPETTPKGTLVTRDNFNGCIRNVMIGSERRDWTDMAELHNIHLSSCPIQQ